MTWALLLVMLVVVGIMALVGGKQVPWSNKLRRIHAGVAGKAEWLAPDDVLAQVRRDYLDAVNWLEHSMLEDWGAQWAGAPMYLVGLQLKRHQKILLGYRTGRVTPLMGILKAAHDLEVRCFSDDGATCLVVDRQTEIHMTTYRCLTQQVLQVQKLDDTIVVYQMEYDQTAKRWKIGSYVQELPTGWGKGSWSRHIGTFQRSSITIGRDN